VNTFAFVYEKLAIPFDIVWHLYF